MNAQEIREAMKDTHKRFNICPKEKECLESACVICKAAERLADLLEQMPEEMYHTEGSLNTAAAWAYNGLRQRILEIIGGDK